MCGIAGFFGSGDLDHVRMMGEALHHRGPDESGTYCDMGVGFAHARLSILDLTPTGSQPMRNAAGDIVLVFNGEIYNFPELRRRLEARGIVFRGTSDTEVLLYLYQEEGPTCFSQLDGMFAVAIHDRRNGTLVLARDRMGEKPLYWGRFDGTLLFGSELKALMQHPQFRRNIDPVAVARYLAYEYVPGPQSIFAGVQKLPPGSYLIADATQERISSFWEPDFSPAVSMPSFSDAATHLRGLLDTSVAERIIADVPVGVFLSGGLDSSAVTAFAQRHAGRRLATFSIGFPDDPTFNEAGYARTVAKHLGTDHHEHAVRASDLVEAIPNIMRTIDEPFADTSIIPTYLLSRFARTGVTVALGGDGGDELFAGYPTFHAERIARLLFWVPWPLWAIATAASSRIPGTDGYMSISFKAHAFSRGMMGDPAVRHQRWIGSFCPEELSDILVPEISKITGSHDIYAPTLVHNNTLEAYMRTYMVDDVLVKVDRASMLCGLEVRAPFLAGGIVAYVNHLPYEYKYRGDTTKALLKSAMRGILPDAIIDRPKHGFGAPVARWIKHELRDMVAEMLNPVALAQTGLFRPQAVSRLVREHQEGRRDHRKKVWTLLMFMVWYRTWMNDSIARPQHSR